jgi:hypothetical protein
MGVKMKEKSEPYLGKLFGGEPGLDEDVVSFLA